MKHLPNLCYISSKLDYLIYFSLFYAIYVKNSLKINVRLLQKSFVTFFTKIRQNYYFPLLCSIIDKHSSVNFKGNLNSFSYWCFLFVILRYFMPQKQMGCYSWYHLPHSLTKQLHTTEKFSVEEKKVELPQCNHIYLQNSPIHFSGKTDTKYSLP